jgi:hypothetical protein
MLCDFINNELKIVLTVKNIKDGYADCEVHFETTEHKNDERGWKHVQLNMVFKLLQNKRIENE